MSVLGFATTSGGVSHTTTWLQALVAAVSPEHHRCSREELPAHEPGSGHHASATGMILGCTGYVIGELLLAQLFGTILLA